MELTVLGFEMPTELLVAKTYPPKKKRLEEGTSSWVRYETHQCVALFFYENQGGETVRNTLFLPSAPKESLQRFLCCREPAV